MLLTAPYCKQKIKTSVSLTLAGCGVITKKVSMPSKVSGTNMLENQLIAIAVVVVMFSFHTYLLQVNKVATLFHAAFYFSNIKA